MENTVAACGDLNYRLMAAQLQLDGITVPDKLVLPAGPRHV